MTTVELTPPEITMCQIFADVLDVSEVDARDDFFDLGGHSLLATRLISRVRVTFGVELDFDLVFDHPTASELVAHLPTTGSARPALHRMARPRE